ncbi:LOW QUALITY PROTEIN: hypothetical protein HZS_805 [Henneguya salminicola]|nr:LOW QUALITY PROTEIN: hypothetical protein HZS_805 [Henneguya salminicola]
MGPKSTRKRDQLAFTHPARFKAKIVDLFVSNDNKEKKATSTRYFCADLSKKIDHKRKQFINIIFIDIFC